MTEQESPKYEILMKSKTVWTSDYIVTARHPNEAAEIVAKKLRRTVIAIKEEYDPVLLSAIEHLS